MWKDGEFILFFFFSSITLIVWDFSLCYLFIAVQGVEPRTLYAGNCYVFTLSHDLAKLPRLTMN